MEKTSLLLDVLQTKKNYEEVIETKPTFVNLTVSEYLNQLIELRDLKKSEIISQSGLERTYAYQIFSGIKTPTRDKLLALAMGMKLTFDEVQDLLKITNYAQLYAKKRRDNIIIFAFYKGQNIWELNDNLLTMGEELIV